MAVTWNPADKSADITLSNGDLTGSNPTASGYRSVRATVGKSTGKWYWEITVTGASAYSVLVGVGDAGMNLENYVGGSANSCGYQQGLYKMGTPGAGSASGNQSKTTGDIISLVLDVGAGTLDMWLNGSSSSPMGQFFTNLTGNTWYPACTSDISNAIFTANFGASTFAYTMPGGYSGYGAAGGMNLFFKSFP